jgi:hypothetical protein
MKPHRLGIYSMGRHEVELWVDPNSQDGAFWSKPEHGKLPRIQVGLRHEDWRSVLCVLIHECMEWQLTYLRARYTVSSEVGQDSGSYLFSCNHQVFDEACVGTAIYLAECYQTLKREWENK